MALVLRPNHHPSLMLFGIRHLDSATPAQPSPSGLLDYLSPKRGAQGPAYLACDPWLLTCSLIQTVPTSLCPPLPTAQL